MREASARYIVHFGDVSDEDHSRVGGKCMGLRRLISAGANVPPGFAVTTDAYADMLSRHRLGEEIANRAKGIRPDDVANLIKLAEEIRDLIKTQPIPVHVVADIRAAYDALCQQIGDDAAVAVRSSGTAEDLPDASFAGQGDTYLWTVGADAVVDRVRDCWASLFTARAIAYRTKQGFDHLDLSMAVGVQKMVDARAAGVAMTIDPSNGDRSKIVIESTWGLGEPLVSGEVTPDHFVIDKVLLETVKRTIACKQTELVADSQARRTVLRTVEQSRQNIPSLTEAQLRGIAAAVKSVEKALGSPQDIEWAIDAQQQDGKSIILLQSRPETVWSNKTRPENPTTSYAVGIEGVLGTLMSPLAVRDTQQKQAEGSKK
jgi:pyruvate,water dikinase